MRKELSEYAKMIEQIRILSAVHIGQGLDRDKYIDKLRTDYRVIGGFGRECRKIMDDVIYPVLKPEYDMSLEEIIEFQEFCEALLEPASGDELDLSLLYEISKKLLSQLSRFDDNNLLVIQLHTHINVCYANVNRTSRITVTKELAENYKNDGLRAAEALVGFKDKEKFLSLNNEARQRFLRGYRFYSALYDTFYTDEECNIARFQALKDAIEISHDSFYVENVKDYDWNVHIFRCIEHMGQLTERGNRWNFTRSQCIEICGFLTRLDEMWKADSSFGQDILPEVHLKLILLRNNYLAGNIAKEKYQDDLLNLYNIWSNNQYDMYSVQANLLIPAEYISTLDKDNLSGTDKFILATMYQKILDYIGNSVNMNAFNYLQEYLVAIWESFIEAEGGLTYKEMFLKCMASLHPPTYIHSIQVSKLAVCLCSHLLYKMPEYLENDYFTKTYGCELNSAAKILDFVSDCGKCHDYGKLSIIDTVFVYGRKLFDSEFNIIKSHPSMGAAMLASFESTKDMALIAKNHHVWHNRKGGYPFDASPESDIVTDIISIADSIDAATDSIGRSYNTGKQLSEVVGELIEGAGTRYSSAITDILKDDIVINSLSEILNNGRMDTYGDTFDLLLGYL